MSAPKLGSKQDLKNIYKIGAMAGMETMSNCTIAGDENYPVRLLVKGADGDERFEFWIQDVDDVLQDAIKDGDTVEDNPNLSVLKRAFNDMLEFRDMLGHPPYTPERAKLPDHINTLLGLDNG